MTIAITSLIAFCIGALSIIIVASIMRCPKCRRWHDCKEEQEKCKG